MNKMAEKVVIGNAELWHGDCREVLPLLPKHDLVLTDPPYGIGYAANPIVGKGKKASNHAGKTWDEETPPPWLFGLMQEKGKHLIVWGGNYYPLPTSRGWLSWFKPDSPPSMGHFELAWTSMDMLCRQFERSIGATNYERVGHPTQKPIMLMGWCIDMTPDNATVLDPFMGSGTTGVACAQLGKSFTGIERERKYFDIACERIENAYRQEQMFPVDIEPARAQDALL